MLKKFVPLTSSTSPSKNPYEIRTFMGGKIPAAEWRVDLCQPERKCEMQTNSTISKVMTIEDELKRLHQKAKESRFQRDMKKRCARDDEFTVCTVLQRAPHELRKHSVYREKYLKVSMDLARRVHDGDLVPDKVPSRIELESPHLSGAGEEEQTGKDEEAEEETEGPVKPRPATPSCSMDVVYMPTQRMLELKRPKSGMYHNEMDPPLAPVYDGLEYSAYNPRVLQEQMNAQNIQTIDLIEGRSPNDLWTWNIGVQQGDGDMKQAFLDATIKKLDCEDLELKLFNIPKDLDKTFSAEIVFGTDRILPDPPRRKPPYYYRPKEVSSLYVAYVESFRFNPDFWTSDILDGILATGEKLLQKSASINYKDGETKFDIIPQIPEKQAAIGLRLRFSGPFESEPNIYKALAVVFSKANAAMLTSKDIYLLIWKRCINTFYVFDPHGRNELCQRSFEEGKCSLMAINYVEHLVHLIVNFSELDMEQEFCLYEIFLKSYGRIPNPISMKPHPKPTRKLWAVVNDTYAIIPAGCSGLTQPKSGSAQNPSMLIALAALLYAGIERAMNWTPGVIDDVFKFGSSYHKKLSRRLRRQGLLTKKAHINAIDLPEMMMLGTFRATLEKVPFLYTGHVTNCPSYLESQLTAALRAMFAGQSEAALLQIDNSVFAVWRDRQFFYLFDPFKRNKTGQVLDAEDFRSKGVAVLQMHTNFESFCRFLYQKAINVRRGGKFFLHGINIGCIKPLPDAPTHSLGKYPRLQLAYPNFTNEPPAITPILPKKGKPCRVPSIKSIPDEERLPEFEDAEVVNAVLDEVICDVLKMLPEEEVGWKTYKQVGKVLLRSDKEYLENLKYQIRHGEDYDNVHEAFKTKPGEQLKPPTLEEELQTRSNFETLPDGASIIIGNMEMPLQDDSMNKLCGLRAILIAAALTSKYSIVSWNSDLIDFTVQAASDKPDEFGSYDQTLALFLAKRYPKICIGDSTYCIQLERVIESTITRSLREMLLENLLHFRRIFVICQRFSCLIVKRFNFLYMFFGFPCTPVGYRNFGAGPACMLRFLELDSLIRRIEFGCNPQGCSLTNYVAVAIKVLDITQVPPERFIQWPEYDEAKVYATELRRLEKLKRMKMDKIRFLDKELTKENERIKKFLDEKEGKAGKEKKKGPTKKKVAIDASEGGEGTEEELTVEDEGEEEEEGEVELKHKPGKQLQRERQFPFKARSILYGYHMREKDCLFKIQGSIALEGRDEAAANKIKPCFFVSTLAILYAILRPLHEWSSQRVDRVVECGRAIASKVTNMTSAFERFIRHITVDDYKFDVWVKTYNPLGAWGSSVSGKINKATQARRYLLLHTSNATYAIYRDEYFHLFDPYGSMEKMVDEEEEDDEEKPKKCPADIKRFGERNTASWVLFVDVAAMLKYIDARAANGEWQKSEEYALHVVDIISHKKAGPGARILQLLTDLSVPIECKTAGDTEPAICLHAESLSWLDLEHCVPVWSRMNRRNTSGRYRNLQISKKKEYDIEIEGRLWSLWGTLHPQAPVFGLNSRGKQYLACNVMACCAASIYQLADWSSYILDTIVINGDRYHRESMENIELMDYEFSVEDLNMDCMLQNIKFVVHIEHVAFGKLYTQPTRNAMNLADALTYFFVNYKYGILQCHRRSLAIGRTTGIGGGYFMFDCQSRDVPLFPKGQGAAYVLLTKHLQVLLYCIVVTLNVPYYNMEFTLHKVEMLRDGAPVEETEEEEENTKEPLLEWLNSQIAQTPKG